MQPIDRITAKALEVENLLQKPFSHLKFFKTCTKNVFWITLMEKQL